MPVARPVREAVKLCAVKFTTTDCNGVLLSSGNDDSVGVVPHRKKADPGEPCGLTVPFKFALLLVTYVASRVSTLALLVGAVTRHARRP